jgi:23S rRNA pseudouridine955/2504/2580 synthase
MIEIKAGPNESSVRLDRILRKKLPLMSLSAIYGLIRRGGVRINGKRVKQDYRVKEGDDLRIDADPAEAARKNEGDGGRFERLVKTDFFKRNFRILHEDRDVLACDKPYGLVVHPGSGHLAGDTLFDLVAAYLMTNRKIASPDDMALVHRLDRDTSGVILIAKNKRALRGLHEEFRDRSLTKHYVAICHHRPPDHEGEIVERLARGRDERGETTMCVDRAGMLSRTRYRLEAFDNDLSRVELFLDTGRTHQIRAHMAHAGAPLAGDIRYGDAGLDDRLFASRKDIPRRLYLHAWKLAVPHPSSGKPVRLESPLPGEFLKIMAGPRSCSPLVREIQVW